MGRIKQSNSRRTSWRLINFNRYFAGLMRTPVDSGKGAALAKNCRISLQGYPEKTKGDSLFAELSEGTLLSFDSHVKEDGGGQIICLVNIGGVHKMRVIDSNGIEIIPPSDPVFTGFTLYRSSYTDGISYITTEKMNEGYKWDGVDLVNIPYLRGPIASDGKRIAYEKNVGVGRRFSRSDIATADTAEAGTGVEAHGDYNTSVTPIGVYSLSTGVLFMGRTRAEVHWVRDNASADGVSFTTKVENFSFSRTGVDHHKKFCLAGNSAFYVNDQGIWEMNVYSGVSKNLIHDTRIGDYFSSFNAGSARINYHAKEGLVVCVIASNEVRDISICIDVKKQSRDAFIRDDQGFDDFTEFEFGLIGRIGNKLYKIFDGYTSPSGSNVEMLYIHEWSILTRIRQSKLLGRWGIDAVSLPDRTYYGSVFFDGSINPSLLLEESSTESSGGEISSVVEWGNYVFGLGGRRNDITDKELFSNRRVSRRFYTMTVGVRDSSDGPFVLKDIWIKYKSLKRIPKKLNIENKRF